MSLKESKKLLCSHGAVEKNKGRKWRIGNAWRILQFEVSMLPVGFTVMTFEQRPDESKGESHADSYSLCEIILRWECAYSVEGKAGRPVWLKYSVQGAQ